jgi:hypothetical protein
MDWQSLKSRKSAGFARSSTPYAVSYTHEFGIIQAEKPQSLGSKLQRRLWFATAAPANKAVIAGHKADRWNLPFVYAQCRAGRDQIGIGKPAVSARGVNASAKPPSTSWWHVAGHQPVKSRRVN